MDGADLTLEFKWFLDKPHGDRTRACATDKDGAVAEDAPYERLSDIDGLNLADHHLVGVTPQQAVAMEEATVAQKDSRRQVTHQFSQIEIGKPVQFGAVDDVLALG